MKPNIMVLVKLKQYYHGQKPSFFIGKILEASEGWVTIHGKGILFDTGKSKPVSTHDEARTIIYPKENIAHIRILPDHFDIALLDVYLDKNNWYLRISDAPDACLAETA